MGTPTLHPPDPMFFFPSPENEFRGELLNQRWTCGEKISSCEGAASLHGTCIKVSPTSILFLDGGSGMRAKGCSSPPGLGGAGLGVGGGGGGMQLHPQEGKELEVLV